MSRNGLKNVFSRLQTASETVKCDRGCKQKAMMCSQTNGHEKDVKRGWNLLWQSLANKVIIVSYLPFHLFDD